MKIFYLILIFLAIKCQSIDSKSTSRVKVTQKSSRNSNGFAQVSIWGNSSAPSIFNSLLNSSSHHGGFPMIASDPIVDIVPPVNDFSGFRPSKAFQRFKHFNLRLGNYFHLQGMGATSNHHIY